MCPFLSQSLWLVGEGDSAPPGLGHVFTPGLLLVKASLKLPWSEGGRERGLVPEVKGIKSGLTQPIGVY